MRLTAAGRVISATILVGILAGLGAVGFHYVSDRFGEWLFARASTLHVLARLPYVIIVPTVGLLLIGIFLQAVPESRCGGVNEVIEALERHNGLMPISSVLNVLMSGLVLAVGGSVGPEGPMVQWGAMVGSQTGKFCRVTKAQLQTLARAGAAAGISAVFRSPAGSVLLTLEIFGAGFDRDLPAIAIASGIGYLVRITILGDAYPFRPLQALVPLSIATTVIVLPLMGVLAAYAGHFFIRLFEHRDKVLPARWPLWFRVTLGGAMVGFIAIWFPQILSAGYPTIRLGIDGHYGFWIFVVLLLLKMLATTITFGSGAVGGLFAPTLVIGSLFGGAFGYGLHALFPAAVPQPALFVLLGMIVMFGSIVKGYWSGLLMVADLSGCYHQLLLPGLIAGGIAYLVGWHLHDKSIFGLSLERMTGTDSREVAGEIPEVAYAS